ncbi:cell division protein FtsL [Neptunicella marina]|uniref:Cell division protein FtsL n=1 Tax=Neptunicella marina TaxID=2125989 RepID=A0A8J6M3D6_9ALTE|nr:cell division protein FtsL [Neptunicella marina]MBC3765291.1 cell division protein FtsL [Neptunicella marina]
MSKSAKRINLASLIGMDLLHHPFRILLFVLVILSAAGVVLSTHHNRQLAIVLESLMQERDQLDVEWRHLILEQSVLTEHNRIETIVSKKLDMQRPDPDKEIVVRVR